jgi:hypothetical protein
MRRGRAPGGAKLCRGARSEGLGAADRCELDRARKRAACKRDSQRGRRSRPRIVIGEEREQDLLADGPVLGPPADALEPPAGVVVELPHEDGVGDELRLEQPLEFCVGDGELTQCLGEDGVRLLAAEEKEELVAEHQRGLGPADGVDGQRVGLT